ncbi:hypothetical protein T05_244 [Trichinella murrelli]|uniref:Uncharacterized protein n=1 Tax=Trichinella murrelli TaxID=144512 RepID=A0A0V0U1P1_9BILA|nr:hypothetical protein T05_244 [Trichinella murrelli]
MCYAVVWSEIKSDKFAQQIPRDLHCSCDGFRAKRSISVSQFAHSARARASCLFVVEDLQEGEVKIAMVAQCVPIVHILVSLP